MKNCIRILKGMVLPLNALSSIDVVLTGIEIELHVLVQVLLSQFDATSKGFLSIIPSSSQTFPRTSLRLSEVLIIVFPK